MDLWLIKTLFDYKTVDLQVAEGCLKTAFDHLQYFAPEFLFLSLVSNKIPAPDKKDIAQAILRCKLPLDENREPNFPIGPPKPAVPITKDTQLWELAKGSRVFLPFHLLQVGWGFLEQDPSTWKESCEFRKLEDYVQRFRVVNDCAERYVQTFSDYHGKVTKSEVQRQFLMSAIKNQRRERSDLRRKALMAKSNRAQSSRTQSIQAKSNRAASYRAKSNRAASNRAKSNRE